MAPALQIDTPAFCRKPREAGADERLADTIVEGLTATDMSELATKGHIGAVRAEIAEVKVDLVNGWSGCSWAARRRSWRCCSHSGLGDTLPFFKGGPFHAQGRRIKENHDASSLRHLQHRASAA